MSNILTPTDTITITIDNRTSQVSCAISRDMPFPQVVGLFAMVLQQMAVQTMQRLTGPLGPPPAPPTS